MAHHFKKYIKQQYHSYIPAIKYKTNFSNCILQAFEQRGYQKVQNDTWDIIWSQKQFIPQLYEKKLANHQKINHFRNYYELCRKDQLIKNLKKHKKNLQKQGKAAEANSYSFYPQTYILPNEYFIFADQFKRIQSTQQNNVWIMKPTGKSQGKGIFLFNKLSQVAQWENYSAQPYIVQRYINDPLLIGGKKFDIRLYALVTSYSPLTIYFYRGGFARFTHTRYDQTKIQNSQIHLTNVAIQKLAEGYDQTNGGKWYIEKLKHYLLSKYGQESANQCFFKVQEIIRKTLQAMQKLMASDKDNSFQLYGFDILLDSKLEPWLIEVNGSPSMTANTQKDRQFKLNLLEDTLTVIDMEHFLQGNEKQIGGFDLISKEKNSKRDSENQRISYLGTLNDRAENLNKIAKNNSARLNLLYQNKKQAHQKKRVMSSATNTTTYTNPTKRNITVKRPNIPQSNQQLKALNSSANTSVNRQNTQKQKEFVIKQKVKRQYTNQNQYQI